MAVLVGARTERQHRTGTLRRRSRSPRLQTLQEMETQPQTPGSKNDEQEEETEWRNRVWLGNRWGVFEGDTPAGDVGRR